jgi:DNA-binding NtrC family response regulator
MKKHVLVIDDEPAVCELLSTVLEDAGYEVSVAYDGPSGLESIERKPPHVLLLDFMLPGMDGIEVLCEARHRWPTLPVIIITAFGTPELTIKANKFSVIEVVSKPFDTNKLLDLIAKVTKDIQA